MGGRTQVRRGKTLREHAPPYAAVRRRHFPVRCHFQAIDFHLMIQDHIPTRFDVLNAMVTSDRSNSILIKLVWYRLHADRGESNGFTEV